MSYNDHRRGMHRLKIITDQLLVPSRFERHPGTAWALKGRYFVKRAGKRVRLVGAGAAGKKGGDACVARVLFPCCFAPAPHR